MRQFIDVYFTTATILNWYPLLEKDEFKDIIVNAMRFAVEKKRAKIFAFVIMNNHFHVVWQILEPFELKSTLQNLLKFTAQQIRANLLENGDFTTLELFRVDRGDRLYQIWERNPLSIPIWYSNVLSQKINYIHRNLLAKGQDDVSYKYSSASFYVTGIKNWDFL